MVEIVTFTGGLAKGCGDVNYSGWRDAKPSGNLRLSLRFHPFVVRGQREHIDEPAWTISLTIACWIRGGVSCGGAVAWCPSSRKYSICCTTWSETANVWSVGMSS